MTSGYSAQERAAIVRKYAGSGMSLEAFSGWAGLPTRRLLSWLGAARPPQEATWVEVELASDEAGSKQREEGASC